MHGRTHRRLELARVSAGDLRFEVVNLSRLSESVCEELSRALPGERSIRCVVQPGLSARGDARLLRAAVRNLVENGFKFTRTQPAPRLEVGERNMDGHRTFFVADNGVGFDMRYAGRLFSPFERLHDDPQYEGTGVGLATVRRIVERHGGWLWAEAEPGRVATFYFTLAA